jgi:Glycosyltransferase like family
MARQNLLSIRRFKVWRIALHGSGTFCESINAPGKGFAPEGKRINPQMARSDWAKAKIAAQRVRRSRALRSATALRKIIDVAHEFARRGIDAPTPRPIPPQHFNGIVSFVTCSSIPEKLNRLRSNLYQAMGSMKWELVAILDAVSLCEGYTRGFDRCKGDVIVFCHDDVEILCDHFPKRLLDALDGADLVGPVGATHLDGPALCWTGQEHLHGTVTHKSRDGAFHPVICSVSGPRIDHAVALDGLLIATHRRVVERVGFDAETFDGLHFHDLDFSYRAHKLGFYVRIQTDLHLLQASKDEVDEEYLRYSKKFQHKFSEFANPPPFVQPVIHEVRAGSLEEAQRTHCWLQHWIAQASTDVDERG